MSTGVKYLLLRSCGHALTLLPVVYETVNVLPYGKTDGVLASLRLTLSAAVIISVVVLCLVRNLIKERLHTPSPWSVACASFLMTAASRVIADKLFYITLAWALGSLAALVPYALARRVIRDRCVPRRDGETADEGKGREGE